MRRSGAAEAQRGLTRRAAGGDDVIDEGDAPGSKATLRGKGAKNVELPLSGTQTALFGGGAHAQERGTVDRHADRRARMRCDHVCLIEAAASET